jgi:hypothetical protein
MARSTKSAQANELRPSACDVARRAYELYCARGYGDGQDIQDWLQAERELREATAALELRLRLVPKRRRKPMPTAIGQSEAASV